jgi:predicted restriction endonuclease
VIHCTESEKTDPYNGIFLSKVFDALFDRGLISFEDDGRILISSSLQEEDLGNVRVNPETVIKLDPRQIPYLRFHREKIFKHPCRLAQ